MNDSIPKVQVDDFSKISAERLPHLKIEDRLVLIGGGGVDGVAFKKKILKMAGWKYHELTSYNAHPEEACTAFNKVLDIISSNDNKDEIERVLKESP
ncbi:MAG: hypothetical protein D6B27_04215 [Gammaproteobacteria bacterium]|nr:MAG: hypothetical protein D6B27_04215 [Gammaproteobacteria bacterium]